MPWSAVGGNVNAHSTASPWVLSQYKKSNPDKPKKKRKVGKSKGKSKPVTKHVEIDAWLKEVDALKDDLTKLKSVFDKKKSQLKKEPAKEPEKEKLEKKPKSDENKDEKSEKDGKKDKDSIE
jgi:hypothetical protein